MNQVKVWRGEKSPTSEFLKDLKLMWNGNQAYCDSLEEALMSFVISEEWTEKSEDQRRDFVFRFQQIKSILGLLDRELEKA